MGTETGSLLCGVVCVVGVIIYRNVRTHRRIRIHAHAIIRKAILIGYNKLSRLEVLQNSCKDLARNLTCKRAPKRRA